MVATTRPYEAVPPEAAEVLRPVLPTLSDETIAAIAHEVPDYARAMEGEFGQMVRLGVEVAFNRFVDLLADPEPDATESRRTYVDLGRGEFHSGRSLDALLAAYRVGARLAWRRFVEAGVAGGLSPDAIYALGEAIFAYIDELSAESAEGYAEEQTAAAGESERRRRRLVRLLTQATPPGQEAIRTAAAAAAWMLPRGGVAALVAATEENGAPGEALLDSIAARLARRLGEGAIGGEAFGAAMVIVPDADAPGRRRRIEAAVEDHPIALGPDRRVDRGRVSARRAIATYRLAAAAAWRGGGTPRMPMPRGARPAAIGHRAPRRAHRGRRPPRGPAARGGPGARGGPRRLAARPARRPRRRPARTAARDARARGSTGPGQVQAVAAALDVHPQTVRYRVRQLRDLFGERLEDPDARFELSLALRASDRDLTARGRGTPLRCYHYRRCACS